MLCTDGPVAERKRRWFLKFDDPDKGYAVFDDEVEAMTMWNRAKDNWTCTLFVTAEFVQPKRESPPMHDGHLVAGMFNDAFGVG